MSVTKLKVEWRESGNGQPGPASTGQSVPLVRVGVTPGERRCPSCNSLVYSRRHKRCGACGQTLPTSCLFSADEAERVDALLKLERERHRVWLKRAAA